jgi:hypothetical protein
MRQSCRRLAQYSGPAQVRAVCFGHALVKSCGYAMAAHPSMEIAAMNFRMRSRL